MRLWSIHPEYLDAKGFVAAWREGLLAKKVLEGKTKGYKNHPQLLRFNQSNDKLTAINTYLHCIYVESVARGYDFDRSKIDLLSNGAREIPVTNLQVLYEFELLKSKLSKRDVIKYSEVRNVVEIKLNSLFYSTPGNIQSWEKIIPEIRERLDAAL